MERPFTAPFRFLARGLAHNQRKRRLRSKRKGEAAEEPEAE
jgi:hypothetical protein